VFAVAAVGAVVLGAANPSLTTDGQAIASIGMPLGGGSIQTVSVVTGPHAAPVAVRVRDDKIYPVKLVPAGETLDVQVVVKRPGWISWLSGKTQRLNLSVATPVAGLRSHYLTVSDHGPLSLHFKTPVATFSYGVTDHLQRSVLAHPETVVTVPRPGGAVAGTIFVAATIRGWETASRSLVSWFPAGGAATAVASPAPGAVIRSDTPITLTFSTSVSSTLGSHLPPVSPTTQGTWHELNSHAIVFRPAGYGYGLGTKVSIALPSDVRLVGGQRTADASGASWTVPGGSTVRLQQMLAMLGYLPLNFGYGGSGVALNPQAQEAAAVKPPSGRFSWRYPNTPSWLVADWQTGTYGEVTKGAVMAFENNAGMTADGVAGAQVWQALIGAVIHSQRYSFGYTIADVSEGSPESLDVWHNGKTVVSTPVNTGIPSAPTVQGTFAVYEHLPVTTMSGTNPDGSHYSDPGIPWVSYFNGGDALHGFIRASYGFPQSLGCVEMPYATAAQVYPFTPIGTLVHVT
jgi:peptidoglycan hydrolase-like protein with peptidoglycan-binding domain